MKKIYILTAVFALLTLSLNAQTRASHKVSQPTATTEKVVTPADGHFRSAPSRASDTPVTPPYTNGFGSTSEWQWWEAINVNGGNTWTYNSSGYAQYQYDQNSAANDWLVTAPITLEAGKKYTFSINAWARSSSYPERVEIKMASGHTATVLAAGTTIVPATEVTATSSSPLTLSNTVTISETGDYYFGIHAISDADMYYLYVDNLSISAGVDLAHDLKVYMSEPSQVYAGQTATISAKVTNVGDFDETGGYTVTIKANGTTISTQTVSESLEIGASKMFYAEYTATEAGTVNLTATVTCADDADATNNEATAALSVIAVPAPQNVAANAIDHNTTVTWDAPNIAAVQVTEDFENIDEGNFEPFDIGGITATNHTGTIGGWTVYDPTGATVWPADDIDWPNEGVPQAWIVFNDAMVGGASAHSGDQYMESICPNSSSVYANSWLISPELSGEAQTITFYESVITSNYPETYEVLYSTTDNNPESFTNVVFSTTSSTASWTLRSVDLPEGAKYFAIRHRSLNQWGLLIDDITYKVAGEQPVSYNVYLDNTTTPVANVDANTFSYDFTNLAYGNHTCYISAVYDGNLESEKVPVTFLNEAKTATPTITTKEENGYVLITATGEGNVTLNVDGQTATGEGTVSIKVVRSTEERTVTATATALAEGKTRSDEATQDVTIPALTGTQTDPATGLLRLHLLILDQMKENIPANNGHPDHYGYVLRYEPTGGDKKESGSVRVDIQKADCDVMGAYTLTEVDNDKHIGRNHDQGIKMDVITADVAYNLSATNDKLYAYLLQGDENNVPGYNENFLTNLQKTQNFTYVEMLETSPNKGHEYPNGEHHYFDAYNTETGVFDADKLETGVYGSDYMSYVPSVSTWGIQRRYFEEDGLDNTYGAPVWKTGAGKVTMDDSGLKAEKQQNAWNSVNWTTEAGPASLFILDGVKAIGLLPHTDVATVEYEPYMFRIFVESPSGKLRPFQTVEAGDGDHDGEHLDALLPDDKLSEEQMYGPISVWDGYIQYDEETGNIIGADAANGVTVTTGADDTYTNQTAYTYTKNKVDRPGNSSNGGVNNQEWNQDSNNAMFGALDAIVPANGGKISTNDLKVFVRFYYAVKGEIADHTVGTRVEGSRSGNGAESEGSAAGPSNSVYEISYHGEIVGQTYYNVQGMESDKPFDGVNIVVTRYSDGSVVTTKVVK